MTALVRSSKFVHSLFFNFFVQFSPIEFNPLQFSPIFWGRTRRNSENFAALGGLVKMRNYLELSWKSTSCVSSTAIGPRTKPLAVFNHKPQTTRLCRGFRRRQGYDGQASGQADPQPLPFQRTGACAPHTWHTTMPCPELQNACLGGLLHHERLLRQRDRHCRVHLLP